MDKGAVMNRIAKHKKSIVARALRAEVQPARCRKSEEEGGETGWRLIPRPSRGVPGVVVFVARAGRPDSEWTYAVHGRTEPQAMARAKNWVEYVAPTPAVPVKPTYDKS